MHFDTCNVMLSLIFYFQIYAYVAQMFIIFFDLRSMKP